MITIKKQGSVDQEAVLTAGQVTGSYQGSTLAPHFFCKLQHVLRQGLDQFMPGGTSSLSHSQMLCQRQEMCYSAVKIGQHIRRII